MAPEASSTSPGGGAARAEEAHCGGDPDGGVSAETTATDEPGTGCGFTLYDTSKFCGEELRVAALQELGMLDTRREDYFDRITALLMRMFETPCSHLVLVDPKRCWFKSWQGAWNQYETEDGVQCGREMGWCNYILVSKAAEILIIEDAQKDARVSLNPFVIGPPYFRFYAGAPLVGSRGERYGTLCVADFSPRAFTAEKYAMLVNFAALAVEELERNKRLADKVPESIDTTAQMDMSLQAVREGILMLDMRESSWPIVYANSTFAKTTGLSSDELASGNFWDLFDCSKTRLEIGLAIGIADSFELTFVCKASQTSTVLRFLPASSDRLAPSKATGSPAWAPCEGTADLGSSLATSEGGQTEDIVDEVKCFWFAVVRSSSDGTPLTNTGSVSSDNASAAGSSYGDAMPPRELGEIRLGPLLGSGSFGMVYRATTSDNRSVAVKVIDCKRRVENAADVQLREVQLSYRLGAHPHIVRVLAYATSSGVAGTQEMVAVWMVQELCDMGTLTLAAERGWLREERNLNSPADMSIMVPTLLDVAKAMNFVHGKAIVHADLTGNNVLLTGSEERACGFVAKVCDFGFSRYTHGKPFETKVLGTITHMPPELLSKNMLVPAADVWAFGVLSWEAFHGKCSYHGRMAPQIVVSVLRNRPLPWPPEAPPDFVALVKRCMTYEYEERPGFEAVLQAFEDLARQCGTSPTACTDAGA